MLQFTMRHKFLDDKFVRDFVVNRDEASSPKFLHGQDIEVQAVDV